MNPVRWGVLSTASIARVVVEAAGRSEVTRFVAVASRDGDRARRFAGDLGLEQGLDLPRRDELELDTVSRAIASGAGLPFGRADAIDQARALQAVISSGERAAPVVLG